MHIGTIIWTILIAIPIIAIVRRIRADKGETYVHETPRDAWEYGKSRVWGE